jgi:hypothetical protein
LVCGFATLLAACAAPHGREPTRSSQRVPATDDFRVPRTGRHIGNAEQVGLPMIIVTDQN